MKSGRPRHFRSRSGRGHHARSAGDKVVPIMRSIRPDLKDRIGMKIQVDYEMLCVSAASPIAPASSSILLKI
jgi:hypothetical protein